MDRSGALWIAAGVVTLIFFDLLFVELRRIFREGKRLVTRLQGYAGLPVFSLLASSETDLERLAGALDAIPPLIERGRRAAGVLRGYLPKGSSSG